MALLFLEFFWNPPPPFSEAIFLACRFLDFLATATAGSEGHFGQTGERPEPQDDQSNSFYDALQADFTDTLAPA
jgi:hypothetical protein